MVVSIVRHPFFFPFRVVVYKIIIRSQNSPSHTRPSPTTSQQRQRPSLAGKPSKRSRIPKNKHDSALSHTKRVWIKAHHYNTNWDAPSPAAYVVKDVARRPRSVAPPCGIGGTGGNHSVGCSFRRNGEYNVRNGGECCVGHCYIWSSWGGDCDACEGKNYRERDVKSTHDDDLVNICPDNVVNASVWLEWGLRTTWGHFIDPSAKTTPIFSAWKIQTKENWKRFGYWT